jgi:phosphoglycerate-specific signal transduction histidine kinase
MTKRNSKLETAGAGRVELGDELQQPLTAACNYIGAARLLLAVSSQEANDGAVRNLDNAEIQILRAGDIIRRFQRAKGTQTIND